MSASAPSQHPLSLAPGDSTGLVCYARFVTLLGPKCENLAYCVGLVNKFFMATVGADALVQDHGVPRVPLVLNYSFAWKAYTSKYKNYNVRRDIYAAWSVLRDRCSGKARSLSAYGKEYEAKHPAWDILQPQEFAALYAPAATPPKITLGTFQIRGVSVTEFTA